MANLTSRFMKVLVIGCEDERGSVPASTPDPNHSVVSSSSLGFRDHDLGRLDDRRHGVPLPQSEFLSAAARDDRIDDAVADAHGDVGEDIADLYFVDGPLELVSSAQRHETPS